MFNDKISNAAHITLQTCLGLKPGETLLIVEDENSPHAITQALYAQAKQLGALPIIISVPPRQLDGQELPPVIAAALLNVDVFLGPTSKSFSHTDARRAATKAGVRGATLPGVTEDMFARLMQADYQVIKQQSGILLKKIKAASQIHITSPSGTDLHLEIPFEFEPDHGILDQPGDFGNLPAGEVMGAPANSHGIMVFDRLGDTITEPTRLTVKDNRVVDIQANDSGHRLRSLLDQAVSLDRNQNALYLAEIGIGLNPLAKITGNVLEDEKVLDTCHIALGDNTSYPGGTNHASIHVDGVIIKPKLEFISP